jgi:two-component system, OmpR family, sensor histidine kinase BaeS
LTIRRQWLLVLTLTAVLAVFINSLLLASMINRYFLSYTAENYNNHVGQIEELALHALTEGDFSGSQLSVQFESHLDDPIRSIKLYDNRGQLLAIAENKANSMHEMMNERMRARMNSPFEEVDSFEISDGGTVLGTLNITRYSTLNDSVVSTMFKLSLLRNSVFSFAVVLVILISIGIWISKKMSKDLSNTASLAVAIDLGNQSDITLSKIEEIKIIQQSLQALHSKLRIKQLGRKQLIDELVHQARTPLTVLKAHLEGLQDGLIEMTPEEISICDDQIENITSIIANMSMMLDADIESGTVKPEILDINSLIKQMISGLKIQFDNKQIDLQLLNHEKVSIKTDKYKLSQSIYNILTNAYKFTPPRGKVEISYKMTDKALEITIKDTGIGIPEEDKANLFDAYYRGRNVHKIAGEGLGLFVVRENLAQIGGRITVSSKAGIGSTFIITLPDTVE